MKQKLSRLLNTEFSWIELQLGERKLQNDQVNDFLIYKNVDKNNKNSIKVLGKLGGEQDGSLEIHLSIVESPDELDALLKMPPFSEKEEDREKTKDNDSESFDAFLARQPHNPRPRLIYQPEKDLLEKDEREGTMGRFENMYLYL